MSVLSVCQVLGQKYRTILRIPPLNFENRKKAENLGKNSPKIQGRPQHDQFWKVSSTMDSASHAIKIEPLDPLGAEKFGVKFLTLKPDF